jgi:hypothetical protein
MEVKMIKSFLIIQEGTYEKNETVYFGDGSLKDWKEKLGRHPSADYYKLLEFQRGVSSIGPYLQISSAVRRKDEEYSRHIPPFDFDSWVSMTFDQGSVSFLEMITKGLAL